DACVLVAFGRPLKCRRQLLTLDSVIAEIEAEIILDREIEWLVGAFGRLCSRGRKVDIDIHGCQRCCDHEDDEQNKHNVNEWRYIDFMIFRQLFVMVLADPASHGSFSCYERYGRLPAAGRYLTEVQIAADQTFDRRR